MLTVTLTVLTLYTAARQVIKDGSNNPKESKQLRSTSAETRGVLYPTFEGFQVRISKVSYREVHTRHYINQDQTRQSLTIHTPLGIEGFVVNFSQSWPIPIQRVRDVLYETRKLRDRSPRRARAQRAVPKAEGFLNHIHIQHSTVTDPKFFATH